MENTNELLEVHHNPSEKLLVYMRKEILFDIYHGLSKQLVEIVKDYATSHITVGEWDSGYNEVNQIIYKLDPNSYEKYRVPSRNKEVFELTLGARYFIKLSPKNWMVVSQYQCEVGTWKERSIKLLFIGNKRYFYRSKIIQKIARPYDKNRIRIQHIGDLNFSHTVPTYSIDHMVMKKDVRDRIMDGLRNWEKSKNWYKEHELLHKIGVLLYGKPGTGKSTLVRAISNMFRNAPIYTIDPSNVVRSLERLLQTRKRDSGVIIVLIEDFDMCFQDRDDNSQEIDSGTETSKTTRRDDGKSNMNTMFQILDGIYSTNDTIYIATTNYIERLDAAMIRPGRFDIQEELGYFDRKDAEKFIKSFDMDPKLLDEFGLEEPIQPVLLQSKIMDYRSFWGDSVIISPLIFV